MSLIRKHVAVLQAWACLALVTPTRQQITHTYKRTHKHTKVKYAQDKIQNTPKICNIKSQ